MYNTLYKYTYSRIRSSSAPSTLKLTPADVCSVQFRDSCYTRALSRSPYIIKKNIFKVNLTLHTHARTRAQQSESQQSPRASGETFAHRMYNIHTYARALLVTLLIYICVCMYRSLQHTPRAQKYKKREVFIARASTHVLGSARKNVISALETRATRKREKGKQREREMA